MTAPVQRYVSHTPLWAPRPLRVDVLGGTAPGWICVHELENGQGVCEATVFNIVEAVGDHGCLVDADLMPPTAQERLLHQARTGERRRVVAEIRAWADRETGGVMEPGLRQAARHFIDAVANMVDRLPEAPVRVVKGRGHAHD